MAPFVFSGKMRDYWPMMEDTLLDKFDKDKEIYFRNRGANVNEHQRKFNKKWNEKIASKIESAVKEVKEEMRDDTR